MKKEDYRERIPEIHKEYKKNGLSSLSFFCACNGLPLLVYLEHCLEIDPGNEEILSKMERLRKFYE